MVHTLAAEQRLQELLTNMGRALGANMLLSKVNAVVFAEPKPISIEDIAQRTGYSLASVSNAVKILEQAHKISRVKMPGTKKVYVKYNNNMIETLRDSFQKTQNVFIKPLAAELPHIIKELEIEMKKKSTGKQKKEQLKEKIDWYNNYLEQNKHIQELIEHIHEHFEELMRKMT